MLIGIVLVMVVLFVWIIAKLMSTGNSGNSKVLKRTESAGGECDSLFQENTKFLLDVGVRALHNDSDGGFIKIWYDGKDCELQINFEETQLLRMINSTAATPEHYMEIMYDIHEDEYKKFQSLVKTDIKRKDEYTDEVCFYHKYGCGGNGVARRRWLVEHIREYYPQYEMNEYSDSVVLRVEGKY